MIFTDFIFLNGNELSTYATNDKSVIQAANNYIQKLKNDGELNGTEWNGGMSTRQILWFSNQLVSAARNNEKVFINGNNFTTKDGTCVRNYIHVLDLAEAHIKALDYIKDKEKLNIRT